MSQNTNKTIEEVSEVVKEEEQLIEVETKSDTSKDSDSDYFKKADNSVYKFNNLNATMKAIESERHKELKEYLQEDKLTVAQFNDVVSTLIKNFLCKLKKIE